MTIQEQIDFFKEQYGEIKKLYPNVSNIAFEITGLSYEEFAAYCKENDREYVADSMKRLRAMSRTNNYDFNVWLYTKPLNIKQHIEVTEIEPAY